MNLSVLSCFLWCFLLCLFLLDFFLLDLFLLYLFLLWGLFGLCLVLSFVLNLGNFLFDFRFVLSLDWLLVWLAFLDCWCFFLILRGVIWIHNTVDLLLLGLICFWFLEWWNLFILFCFLLVIFVFFFSDLVLFSTNLSILELLDELECTFLCLIWNGDSFLVSFDEGALTLESEAF